MPPERVYLTEDLARQLNSVGSLLPDSAKLVDLVEFSESRPRLKQKGVPGKYADWDGLMASINSRQKDITMRVLRSVCRYWIFNNNSDPEDVTVGLVREIPADGLVVARGLSEEGVNFLKIVFGKNETATT